MVEGWWEKGIRDLQRCDPSLSPNQPAVATTISISPQCITAFPYSGILFADTQPVQLWLIIVPLAEYKGDLACKEKITRTDPSLLDSKELTPDMIQLLDK